MRRRLEVADAIDLAVATDHPHQVLAELDKILGAEFVERAPGQAETTLPQGMPVEATLVTPEAFGAVYLAGTGNDEHFQALQQQARELGLTLNSHGTFL